MSESPAFQCRSCGSTRSVVRYAFTGVDKVIRECAACTLMALDPLPKEDELQAVYNDGYFDNAALTEGDVTRVYGYVDYIAERIHKQQGYAEICGVLKRLVIPGSEGPPRLLDYGCGLGFFLDSAFDGGFEPHGLEFNRYAIDYIRRRYAYPVFHSREFSPRGTFDVVTLFDVIEHLREPFTVLDEIHRMLSENGVVAISTMDSKSVTSRLLGKRLEDFRRISEHLFFFSRANLSTILRRHGFEVIATSSLGHSFEIRLLAVRLRSTLPLIGVPMTWLVALLPFVGRWTIHLDPRTKFIAYARKRRPAGGADLTGKTLSIVVPVGEGAAAIEPMLERLLSTDFGMGTELVVASHGPSNAAEIICGRLASRGEVRSVRVEDGGEGAAVAAGLRASRGDYVVLQSAEIGYDPADIGALVATMARTGALAVYGSRYSGRYRRTGPFLRTLASRAVTGAANLLNDLNLSDVMVGCKVLDGRLARALALRSRGLEFEAELLCKLRRRAVPIYEAPVSYEPPTDPNGRRKVGFADGWRTLAALVRYGLLGAE
jgi:SAM-dependent methyltransferase